MSFPRPPRRTIGLGALVMGGLVLGCTGAAPSGRPTSNREACERYADHLNALSSCIGLVYDPQNLCEDADRIAVDLIPTYDCLAEHVRCDGDTPVIDTLSCQLPLVALSGPVAATGSPEEGTR